METIFFIGRFIIMSAITVPIQIEIYFYYLFQIIRKKQEEEEIRKRRKSTRMLSH